MSSEGRIDRVLGGGGGGQRAILSSRRFSCTQADTPATTSVRQLRSDGPRDRDRCHSLCTQLRLRRGQLFWAAVLFVVIAVLVYSGLWTGFPAWIGDMIVDQVTEVGNTQPE